MGRRGNKSSNPLYVAAAAITRSLDPVEPSRVTVLRLLADATRLLDESIRSQAETDGPGRSDPGALSYTRDAFVSGAQAVAASAFTCLMRLGARGGPLRQRAVILFRRASAVVAQTPFLPQAAQDARSHIAGLRKDSQTSKEEFEAQVASSLLVLAEASNPKLAGVKVAEESILFLLGPKLKHLVSRRSDVAIAAAQIVASFTSSLWPDDALVDKAVSYATASASTKLGVGGVGSALLTAACCPFLMRRGNSTTCNAVVLACSRAVRVAPSPAECNAWGVALARAVVCANRMNLKLRPPKVAERKSLPETLPGFEAPFGPGVGSEKSETETLAATLDSPAMFEECLRTVAKSCMPELSAGSVWAIAAVLRMWICGSRTSAAEIPARAVAILENTVVCSGTLTAAKEAIMLAVWEDLKSSDAPRCLRALLALPISDTMSRALSLNLATEVVRTFGTDAVHTIHVGSDDLNTALEVCQLALEANFSTLRQGAVSLVAAIANAAPQVRAHLLTVILQNLRIADLQLADHVAEASSNQTPLSVAAEGLSAILGNTEALAALVDEISWKGFAPAGASPDGGACGIAAKSTVPTALLAQCAFDAEALLTRHPVASSAEPRGKAVAYVRKRAGWALLACLSGADVSDSFEEERLLRLMPLWSSDLGHLRSRSEELLDAANPGTCAFGEDRTDLSAAGMEEISARSACRCAALTALGACLRVSKRKDFRDFAMALLGTSAARLAVADAGIAPLGSSPEVFSSLVGVAASSDSHSISRDPSLVPSTTGDPSQDMRRPSFLRGSSRAPVKDSMHSAESEARKQNWNRTLARHCVSESECLLECIQVLSPGGASGELCYHVAAAMGEEAQRALGDTVGLSSSGGGTTGHAGTQNSSRVYGSPSGRPAKSVADGFVMIAQRRHVGGRRFYKRSELEKLDPGVVFDSGSNISTDEAFESKPQQSGARGKAGITWLFSTEGSELPHAEHILICAAEAIAGLIATNVSESGSMLESLVSTSNLSPAFSACIALALARRLSVYDINATGTGKALASLQVVLRKALTGTISLPELMGACASSNSQKRIPLDGSGAVCTKEAALCLGDPADIPGRSLLAQVSQVSWQEWARSFMFELANVDGGGLSKEFRILGMADAVRGLTAETYRVLGEEGGSTLWLGLTQSVISSLHKSIGSAATSQLSLVSNAVAVLGAMLDVAPEGSEEPGQASATSFKLGASHVSEVRGVVQDAVSALSLALEARDGYVKALAATSISDSSAWVASNSERLFADLVCAWAEDEGGLGFADYGTRFMEEAALATALLRRVWYGMLEGEKQGPPNVAGPHRKSVVPFFDFDMQGPGACVGPYGMGAAAVLAACRLHWWPIGESCAESAGEIASDLIGWNPVSSPTSVAAGLYCLAALWAARLDTLRSEGADDDRRSSNSSHSSMSSFSFGNRISRGGPSPRLLSRTSAESRVPQSPLMPPLTRAFADEFDLDKKTATPHLNSSDYLPCDVFDVGENCMVDILKRLVECMCVAGRGDWWEDVRSASVASLTQLLRGVGPNVLLVSYPELPDALFCALEGCAAGADHVLEHLAKADGAQRLGYWVQLCRRNFFGHSGNELGVSPRYRPGCRTRAIAVASARTAVEAALCFNDGVVGVAAPPAAGLEEQSRKTPLLESAASVLDLACHACEAVHSSAEAAEEGIKLIQGLCTGFQSERFFVENRHQICTALRRASLESCPYSVVRCAISACAAILREICFDLDLFNMLFGDGQPGRLAARFHYDRFSEDVGAEATIACLARMASVVIACHESDTENNAEKNNRQLLLRENLLPHHPVLHDLFVAVVADFASMLSDGASKMATSGSSLTGPGVPPIALESSLRSHICTIVMGAAALCGEMTVATCSGQCGTEVVNNLLWRNQEAPGALLGSHSLEASNSVSSRLTLSVSVWLMYQYSESPLSTDVAMFCKYTRDVFHLLLADDSIPVNDRIEAIMALRYLSGGAHLQVVCCLGRLLAKRGVSKGDEALLKSSYDVVVAELTENPSDIDIGLAFQGLSTLLPMFCSESDRHSRAETLLDVFMFIVNLPPSISLRRFGHRSVLMPLSQGVVEALRVIDNDAKVLDILLQVRNLVQRMHAIDLGTRLKSLTAVAAALGSSFPWAATQIVGIFLDFGDEVVDSMLVCDGGPDFIISCLSVSGTVKNHLPVPVIGSVLRAIVRRMTLGHGPPRQVAARLLVDLHTRADALVSRETILASLLPPLARDQICGRVGTGAALLALANEDRAAFEYATGSLEIEEREAVQAATMPASVGLC